jgi:hypothetical protein
MARDKLHITTFTMKILCGESSIDFLELRVISEGLRRWYRRVALVLTY